MTTPPKPKKPPRIFTVKSSRHITPNMIRVTLAGPEIYDMVEGCEGANCKLFLPSIDQDRQDFVQQFIDGPRPDMRTYTVRFLRASEGEMDIDFVDHGDSGPASAWARRAKPGSFCGFNGPGPIKVPEFYADRYVIAADMSALPVAAATLEAMPKGAVGDAFFEIMHADDRQEIDAPTGVRQHWLVNPTPHTPLAEFTQAVLELPWGVGTVQTCIAGESSMIRQLRVYLQNERKVPKVDCYISGYWKIGLIEDEHQKMKREEAAA